MPNPWTAHGAFLWLLIGLPIAFAVFIGVGYLWVGAGAGLYFIFTWMGYEVQNNGLLILIILLGPIAAPLVACDIINATRKPRAPA